MFEFAETWMWPIVSGIFFSIGVNSIPDLLKFKRNSRKIRGRVKAIEKYRSSSGSGSDKRTHTYYRPIVKYYYNDQTYLITDAGKSRPAYKIDQHVNLLLHVSNDQKTITAVLDNWNYILFDVLIIAITSFFFFLYIYAMNGSIFLISAVFTLLTILGHFFFKKRTKHEKFSGINATWEATKNSIIIETQQDHLKEISSHKIVHNFMTLLFIIIGLACLYLGFTDLPQEVQKTLLSDLPEIFQKIKNNELEESSTKPFLLIGFGIYCLISCFFGFLHFRKKQSSFLKK